MTPALDMQRERARALARAIVERAPGDSIRSIFAGGSLGRGEVWAAAFDGVLEVYSDIDLYVVVAPGADVKAVQRGTASADTVPASVRFLRAPDIGVYTRADLAAQPLRPGTADLDIHHLLLFGDEQIPRSLRGRSAADVAAEEALYLVENRVSELSAMDVAGERTPAARLVLAQALKARLDVYSAHAIVEGSFASMIPERARRFANDPPRSLLGAARDDVADAFAAWSGLASWLATGSAENERKRALAALVRAWSELAPRVLKREGSAAELVARRCGSGHAAANAREVMRLRRVTGVAFWRAALAAARLGARAPVSALRVHALARALCAQPGRENEMSAHFDYVDRLTRRFGFDGGTLDERVRAMHAAIS